MIFLFPYRFSSPVILDVHINLSKAEEQVLRVEGSLHGDVTYFFFSDNMAVQHFLLYTGKD